MIIEISIQKTIIQYGARYRTTVWFPHSTRSYQSHHTVTEQWQWTHLSSEHGVWCSRVLVGVWWLIHSTICLYTSIIIRADRRLSPPECASKAGLWGSSCNALVPTGPVQSGPGRPLVPHPSGAPLANLANSRNKSETDQEYPWENR